MDAIGVPLGFHSATNIIKEEFQVQIPLILDDHVVKNHTSSHMLMRLFLSQKQAGPRKMANLARKAPKALSCPFHLENGDTLDQIPE
jgi:hypothetical protein